MARILITGASGFIGTHIARAAVAAGEDTVCLVRPGSDRRELDTLGVRYASGDITDAASLDAAVREVDIVIHAAAMLKAPWRPAFASANIGGTGALAAACAAQRKPPVLVVVSSLAAAGPAPTAAPRDETQAATPISIYGRVKRDAEAAAAAHASAVPITLVRPPMVFGDGDRSALTLFRNARAGWHPLPGRSNHRLSMIHAADLADLLLRAAHNGERLPAEGVAPRHPGQGLYYASADETPTMTELGTLIAEAQARPAPRVVRIPLALLWLVAGIGELKGRYTDTPQLMNLDKARELMAGPWLCSAQKARDTLGFSPPPLSLRLQQTAEWYRQQELLKP